MANRADDFFVPITMSPALAGLWLLLAVSSLVFIEPAPYDLIAVTLCVVLFALGLKVPVRLGLPLLLMAVFIVANILSTLFAEPSVEQPTGYLIFYMALTVYLIVTWVFFASIVAADPRRVIAIIWSGYLVAAVIAVILALAGYFRWVPQSDLFLHHGRARGPFKDPNVFAPFLIPVALYLLAGMTSGGWAKRMIRFSLFLLMIMGLLLGFSRGAWGHFAVSGAVFAGLWFANAKSLKEYFSLLSAGSGVILISLVVVIGAASLPQVNEMFLRRAQLLQSYDIEAGGRFSTQRAAIEKILENPIGIGPNRTETELGRVPHNLYLKVTAENGWLGGISVLAFCLLTAWRGLWFCLRRGPHQRTAIIVYASLIGIFLESVIIDTLHWRHFFLLLGMLWGIMVAGDDQPDGVVH